MDHQPHGRRLAWLLVLAAGLPPALPAGDPLATATVESRVVEGRLLRAGTVEAARRSTVSAQTGGRVAELPFDVDDAVPAGAVIVRLTATEQGAGVAGAEAAVGEAAAALGEAETELRRVRELQSRGVVAKAELDRAVARRDAAQARVAAARAALATAREQLGYTEIRAPYAGIVTARHVEVGETVVPGQPIMTGLATDRLRVVVDLPQSLADGVRGTRRARVLAAGVEPIEATAVTVFPHADPATRSFRVRLDLPDGVTGLHPGMFVEVEFPAAAAERLLVPAAALVQRGELSAVYVVDADGGVRLRQVRLGRRYADGVEVLAGLAAGERVALDPVQAGVLRKTGAADVP